jgi:sialate O-acetylesterase
LFFDHVNAGLSTPGVALDGFDIAGEDKKFMRAQAKIEGNSVVVWSDKVLRPVAVRYGWANNPMNRANLFSKT